MKYIAYGGEGQRQTHNKTTKHYTKPKKSLALFGLNFVGIICLPRLGVLSSQSLDKYWQLNQTNQKAEHIQVQSNVAQKVALINNKNTFKNLP